ncbi:MAG TPA: hypothetical protein VFH61_08575, partial [Thermoleophilia bacterium]|nr:hypothetical protein [Thermoleophilia bacterium]
MARFGIRGRRGRIGLLVALTACAAMLVMAALLLAMRPEAPADTPTAPSADTPVWQLRKYREIGYVHSYKLDLIRELPAPPKLMTIGGSRTTRFEPDLMRRLTGLPTMNCSVHNCQPEDVWAFANDLRSRAPNVKLRLLWGIRVGGMRDNTFAQGLVYDPRLARWFPPELIDEQKTLIGEPVIKNLLAINRFTPRGMLKYTNYDRQRERGLTLDASLDKWIPTHVSKEMQTSERSTARARAYFEKTMALFNEQGVTPCIVMMPYQPRAFRALSAVPQWKTSFEEFRAYLKDMRATYDFRLLDYTQVGSFGGRDDEFFDGAHVTVENSRLLLRKAVQQAPECF